ncbi:hypothetical protein [Pseudomonas fulva]|uniref:hypothetical protein n=1 Tax=Pseudomonas fulva TaxID=47880 RepID=UPI000F766E53|nr:hypothetical protein [Pseudomonas fulva]MBA1209388.1 hypothetical protein [Pseudomonas fulva]MBA1217776.1 hypothetical protein [Pseudomonas fulva]MDH0573256.1 hypothetical protein [Pseudomonas fulva]RRW56920.1 hypothetical protein EGJ51_21335 [Pseudomonas fulva]
MKLSINESELEKAKLSDFKTIVILGNPDVEDDRISVTFGGNNFKHQELQIQAAEFGNEDALNSLLESVIAKIKNDPTCSN